MLAAGHPRLAASLLSRGQPVIDVPWSIAVGNDLRFAEVDGERTLSGRLLSANLQRLLRAAERGG